MRVRRNRGRRGKYFVGRAGDTCNLNTVISLDAYEKADRMAGEKSLGWLTEELIQREWRRRERRMERDCNTISENSFPQASNVQQ